MQRNEISYLRAGKIKRGHGPCYISCNCDYPLVKSIAISDKTLNIIKMLKAVDILGKVRRSKKSATAVIYIIPRHIRSEKWRCIQRWPLRWLPQCLRCRAGLFLSVSMVPRSIPGLTALDSPVLFATKPSPMLQTFEEETATRRRKPADTQNRVPLVHQVVVMLRYRKELRAVCTNTSIALRAVVLCDLAKSGAIRLNSAGRVVLEHRPTRPLECDFAYKISHCDLPPGQLLRALNGEMSKQLAVTQVRKKVYAEMESKQIMHMKKSFLFNKVVLDDSDLWMKLYTAILEEVRMGVLSIGTKVVLIALDYVNSMESLLIQCNETDSKKIISCISELKQEIKAKQCPSTDMIIYDILRSIIR